LQITRLADEGSMASVGDTLIQFDATQQLADLADHQSTLKIRQTTLARAEQEYTIQKKNLELDMQKAEPDRVLTRSGSATNTMSRNTKLLGWLKKHG